MKTVIQSLQNTLENNDTNQQLKRKAIYFTKDIVYTLQYDHPPPTQINKSNNKHCNSYNNQTQKNHRKFYNIDTIV